MSNNESPYEKYWEQMRDRTKVLVKKHLGGRPLTRDSLKAVIQDFRAILNDHSHNEKWTKRHGQFYWQMIDELSAIQQSMPPMPKWVSIDTPMSISKDE